MHEPTPPPDDYVAFVGRCAARLQAAAWELTGSERATVTLVSDLLTATARRWNRLRPPAADPAGRPAAAAYVAQLFRREAADRPYPRMPRVGSPGAPDPLALAARTWAGRTSRRPRLLAAAAIAGLLLIALLVRPNPVPVDEAAAEPTSTPTVEAPTALPAGVDVLPEPPEQRTLAWRDTALPAHIALSLPIGPLRKHPIRRALAAFRMPGSPLMLLGEDGRIRTVPDELFPAVPPRTTPGRTGGSNADGRLPATALSPDGTRLALPSANMLVVLDVPRGTVRGYPMPERPRWVVWTGSRWILVGGGFTSVVLDLATGRVTDSAVQTRSALTPRGPEVRLPAPVPQETGAIRGNAVAGTAPDTGQPRSVAGAVELLSIGEPATAPARVRRHLPSDDGILEFDTALGGELAPWVGSWRGAGFLTRHWAIRDCSPTGTLPVRYGSAMLATAAVNPASGRVHRLLVSTTSESLELPQVVGAFGSGGVLIRAPGEGGTANLLAWMADVGELYMVATMDRNPAMSLADLS